MAEESKSKWEGNISAELPGTSAEQLWPLLEDFCNIHKWIPTIETCYLVDGVAGEPGVIRYCAGPTKDEGGPERRTIIKWAKEKLVMIDPIQRCLSYEVVDSNMGFKSYVATLKVLPIFGDIDENEKEKTAGAGCKIQWSFVCDPVEGWTYQGLFSFVQSSVQSMANNMELECSATHTFS